MEKAFDELINSFIDNELGLSDNFLSSTHILQLKGNIAVLIANDALQAAGTSNNAVVHNLEVRSDQIYWLDRSHNNPSENHFLDLIDAFVLHLNKNCFTSIRNYEFHYAHYDIGSFYTRHLDQFRSNDKRKFSMIFYLNDTWESGDGGELCIHHANQSMQ
ncbi:MAG: 2OG-Fe(II) oxygenase, partial [Chitinophagaceae bacterium]|nr:2OG-Fe(II) oxygenase [Chitinophagaceae bacterium]